MKFFDSGLDKVLGCLSGGLYIIIVSKGEVSSVMLVFWVV